MSGLFKTSLRERIICPHCWEVFAPENSMWIASHPDLIGDARLGGDASQRFLPTRFNAAGNAIDAKGITCQDLACPSCHLPVPQGILQQIPFFMSIAGTPSCGKSYFLASMTWQLRQNLPKYFSISFSDADTTSNQVLNQYEDQQFFNENQDEVVKLAKTEEQGDLYSTVQYEGQTVTYPRPFLFSARPNERHPNFANSDKISRLIGLYDNAGESFQPGKDTVRNPVTRHLSVSKSLLFCFDPTQDPRFRQACAGKSSDYQISDSPVTTRQETVFHEIIARVRRHQGIAETAKTDRILFILCTKFDSWSSLFGEDRVSEPWNASNNPNHNLYTLDMKKIQAVSNKVREILWEYSSELVFAAEGFSNEVYFIPVSATGCAPVKDPDTGVFGVRPKDINPMWCEIPTLVALAKSGQGLIPFSH